MFNDALGIRMGTWAQGRSHRKGDKQSLKRWVERFTRLGMDYVYIPVSYPSASNPGEITTNAVYMDESTGLLDMVHLREAFDGLREQSIDVGFMEWSGLKQDQVERALERTEQLVTKLPVAQIYQLQDDAESYVTNLPVGKVISGSKMYQDGLVRLEDAIGEKLPPRGVTLIPFPRRYHPDVIELIKSVGYEVFIPQAYSWWRDNNPNSHAESTRPGVFQRHTGDMWHQLVRREPALVPTRLQMGLANYDQRNLHKHRLWSGDSFDALRDSALEALRYTNDLCYWSVLWAWKTGGGQGADAQTFREFLEWLSSLTTDDLEDEYLSGLYDPNERSRVAKTQWLLIALFDAKLGSYGPKSDGVDGIVGMHTWAATANAEAYLQVARDGEPDQNLLRELIDLFRDTFGVDPNFTEAAQYRGYYFNGYGE